MNIIIKAGEFEAPAVLNESRSARKVWDALPIEAQANTWGEEIYFRIPVHYKIEKTFARDVVDLGDLAFWPEGSGFCIFFGLTPVSRPGEIRPAGTVNIIGKVTGSTDGFKRVPDGAKIRIEKS